MTSLDDSVISRQNIMLLDNITNYSKPALDYFHHSFSQDDSEMPMTWSLLFKMRKHKLLRLPNCSIEDDNDYSMYAVRLHHCLWRRWSIEHFKLHSLKVDPLTINWDKEIDITVLYGPDLAGTQLHEEQERQDAFHSTNFFDEIKSIPTDWHEEDATTNGFEYSSSLESKASSVFDDHNICTKMSSNSSDRSLKFSDTVLRRDIDKYGAFHETKITINDTKKQVCRRRRGHRHHRRHSTSANPHSDTLDTLQDSISDYPIYTLPDYDEDQLEQNIKSLNLNDSRYIRCI